MALRRSIVMPTSIVCPEAYSKVTEIRLSYLQKRAWITILTWFTEQARLDGSDSINGPIEFRVYNNNSQPVRQSQHTIRLVDALANGNTLAIDKFGDGSSILTITAGVNFTYNNEDLDATASNIADYLNGLPDFSAYYAASASTIGRMIFTSVGGGPVSGNIGNNLNVTGTAVADFEHSVIGLAGQLADFDRFFDCDILDVPGNNVIKMAYEYAKTTPEFESAVDC